MSPCQKNKPRKNAGMRKSRKSEDRRCGSLTGALRLLLPEGQSIVFLLFFPCKKGFQKTRKLMRRGGEARAEFAGDVLHHIRYKEFLFPEEIRRPPDIDQFGAARVGINSTDLYSSALRVHPFPSLYAVPDRITAKSLFHSAPAYFVMLASSTSTSYL